MIKVDFAAHSPDMEPLCADLKRALEGIQPHPPSISLYSTVTGHDAEDLTLDADYWSRNLREPVLFSSAVEQLLTGGHDVFLEISPHPILLSAIQQEFRHTGLEGSAIPSLRRDEQENKVLTSSLGALYTTGYPIEWNRIYAAAGQPIQLPTYPWQRERFWMDPPEVVTRGVAAGKHSLLGRHFKSAQSETHYWEGTLDATLPYLDDHRIEGVAVLPAALYLEMAFAAAAEAFPLHSFTLKDVDLLKALFIIEGETRATQLVLSPNADTTSSIHIYSRANENESVDAARNCIAMPRPQARFRTTTSARVFGSNSKLDAPNRSRPRTIT